MLSLRLDIEIVILAPEPILNLAIWVGIGVFILNICFVGAIFYQRYRNLENQRLEKVTQSRWMPIIMTTLVEIPPSLPSILPSERLFILNLWLQVHRTIEGESRDRLQQLAYILGMQKIARRFLTSRHLNAKLVGISVLGNLKERSAGDKLRKLATNKNPYVSVAAATALVKIDIEQSSTFIADLICDRLDWSLALVVELLSVEGSDRTIPRIIARIPQLSQPKLSRVFRALEVAQKQQLLPVIPQLLHQFSDLGEVVSACLRVLSSYKSSDRLEIIRQYINHSDSSVRVQVANGLSQMGTAEDEPRLIALLSDPVWWVRYRAAQALASLPSMDSSRLEQIQLEQSDRFARDILIQVIAENKLFYS